MRQRGQTTTTTQKGGRSLMMTRQLGVREYVILAFVCLLPMIVVLNRSGGGGTTETATAGAAAQRKAVISVDAHHIRLKRDAMISTCRSDKTAARNVIERMMEDMFIPPPNNASASIEAVPIPCEYTFYDFGANIGDSLGKLIDAGQVNVCVDVVPGAQYSAADAIIKLVSHTWRNSLTEWVRARLDDVSSSSSSSDTAAQPEDYCYYGLEGNPTFTDRLKHLEARVLQSHPRPVRTAHFFTETVGMGQDGPTKLYLDTVNKEQNFWGSSVMKTHTDVQKSKDGGNEPIGVDVMGMTLTSLIRKTMLKVSGGHMMVKMDIEGAEFAVLNDAVDTLCEYAQAGVKVDMLVELHPPHMLGGADSGYKHYTKVVRSKLRSCGVNLNGGNDGGRRRRRR